MGNQPVIFGLIGGGALLLTAAVTNSGLGQTVQGHANKLSTTSAFSGLSSGLVGAAGRAVVTTANGLKGTAGDTHSAAWAKDLLTALGAPTTPANIQSITDWINTEGNLPTVDQYNPLDTTMGGYGGVPTNNAGVRSYPSWSAGINATVATLQSGYPAIVGALTSGQGLSSSDPLVAQELNTWSGGGYSGIGG